MVVDVDHDSKSSSGEESEGEFSSASSQSSGHGNAESSDEQALNRLLGERDTWDSLVDPEETLLHLVEKINANYEANASEELTFRQAVFAVLDDACKGKEVDEALHIIGRGKQMKKWLFLKVALSGLKVKVPEKLTYVQGLLNFFVSGTVEVYVSNWKTDRKNKSDPDEKHHDGEQHTKERKSRQSNGKRGRKPKDEDHHDHDHHHLSSSSSALVLENPMDSEHVGDNSLLAGMLDQSLVPQAMLAPRGRGKMIGDIGEETKKKRKVADVDSKLRKRMKKLEGKMEKLENIVSDLRLQLSNLQRHKF